MEVGWEGGVGAAGAWEGHWALFQVADDDAFHDLKIEFRTLREVGGMVVKGRGGGWIRPLQKLTSCRPSNQVTQSLVDFQQVTPGKSSQCERLRPSKA